MDSLNHPEFSTPGRFPGTARWMISPQLILRVLGRHGCQILLFALMLYLPLACAIYSLVGPTYEAFSVLLVDPAPPELFGPDGPDPSHSDPKQVTPYLQTQIAIIRSDSVLDDVITKPEVIKLPLIKQSKDPRAVLRERMAVEIVDGNTYLIRIALESRWSGEVAAIVNAVTDTYLDQHVHSIRSYRNARKQQLEAQLNWLDRVIKDKNQPLTKRVEQGLAEGAATGLPRPEVADAGNDPMLMSSFDRVSEEAYAKLVERLIQADLDYLDVQARLEAARSDQAQSPPGASEQTLRELKQALEAAKHRRLLYAQYIAKAEVQFKVPNPSALEARLLNQQLDRLVRMQDRIRQKFEQLDFEMHQDQYPAAVVGRARRPLTPSRDERPKYLAAAPVGILLLILGLFLVREIRAARVTDPEALSSRMQSEVYTLPPLPTARRLQTRGSRKPDDGIDRLDYLWFDVCGDPPEREKGRCVLITSAIGGEGKTTVAIRLAARCGQLGRSALLIDADLRGTKLDALLDLPQGPGLSAALIQDQPPPTELVIPSPEGLFDILPAGPPAQGTCCVLQSRQLGALISRFRRLYDLVLIDSPPALPGPDALVLGRWADAALLTARYAVTCLHQLQRTRRRLDRAGIPVLGIVLTDTPDPYLDSEEYRYERRWSPREGPSIVDGNTPKGRANGR